MRFPFLFRLPVLTVLSGLAIAGPAAAQLLSLSSVDHNQIDA
jgi:hypothetical protein